MLNRLSLNKLSLNRVDLNRIGGRDVGVSARPYINPELLSHVKMAISTWGKTNDDPDRAVLKDLSGNGSDMRLLNFGFAEGSGYGLPGTDFEGWLCTDGVDDIIESVKPVSEMLEGSNEITVVSIIHQISQIPGSEVNKGLNNQISYYDSPTTRGHLRNNVKDVGKTGIYGYTFNGTAHSVINNILGDKNDYIAVRNNEGIALNGVFSVCGYKNYYGELKELSSVAYAGGFIANKVLTTDEINQIIAYFNLDRPGQIIKPQLYCNIKKQGIANDNHAEFNDQLIDFVGGHNIQLNNISWEGESGINSYPVVFGANKTWNVIRANDGIDWRYTLLANKITIYKIETSNKSLIYSYVHTASGSNSMTVPAFKIKVDGLKAEESIIYDYISSDNTARSSRIIIRDNGLYDLPVSVPIQVTEITPASVLIGFTIALNDNVSKEGLTIEVLPTIENALCLDGISDFGKATGLPILKDYTICALRKWLYGDSVTSTETGSIVSKSKVGNDGAFILEQTFNRNPSRSSTFSFGTVNSLMSNDKLNEESFTYQTKYSYNGETIVSGSGVDTDSMWLGTIRDGDSRFSKFALRSLMLFSYSLSRFLLERQLRKYNAGTLYPGMVEFRPVIKSNVPYSSVSYSVNPGEYVTEGSTVTITVTLSNETDKLVGVSSSAIADISISGDNGTYAITGKVTKSPQKISIVISSYLTMLNNDTLIENETLIKNE